MEYTKDTKEKVLQKLVGIRNYLTEEIEWYYKEEANNTNAGGLKGKVDNAIRDLEKFRDDLK